MTPITAVLHVAHNPLTGVWSVMRQLAQAQHDTGRYAAVGIGVITDAEWPAENARQLGSIGLPVFRARTPKVFGTASFLLQSVIRPGIEDWAAQLARASGARRVVVHFHNAWLSGVFLPLHPPAGLDLAVVTTFHGVNIYLEHQPVRKAIHAWMARRLLKYGARLTSVAAFSPPLAERILGLPAARFTVIPNGSRRRESARMPWEGGARALRVGHVGTLNADKGWRLAADAVRQARSAGMNVRLVVAGDGPDAGLAREMATREPDVVEHLGFVADAADSVMPSLDVLALMSVQEGLPMSVIEAMSAGVPVVATAVGGLPEVVTDGDTGLLVDRTADALAAALGSLYRDPGRLARLGARTREVFGARFEIGRVIEQYDRVYGVGAPAAGAEGGG